MGFPVKWKVRRSLLGFDGVARPPPVPPGGPCPFRHCLAAKYLAEHPAASVSDDRKPAIVTIRRSQGRLGR